MADQTIIDRVLQISSHEEAVDFVSEMKMTNNHTHGKDYILPIGDYSLVRIVFQDSGTEDLIFFSLDRNTGSEYSSTVLRETIRKPR